MKLLRLMKQKIKKIDLLYQYSVVKDTEINAPNSHNIVFKNIIKDDDKLIFNGNDSLIYIPNFAEYILFGEIKFNTNNVKKESTVIGSQDWSINIKDNKLALLKYERIGTYTEYYISTDIKPFTDYTIFLKCNKNLEVYLDGEKFKEKEHITLKVF